MTALNKEAVKRAKEALKKFNSEIKVIELEQTARTANFYSAWFLAIKDVL